MKFDLGRDPISFVPREVYRGVDRIYSARNRGDKTEFGLGENPIPLFLEGLAMILP